MDSSRPAAHPGNASLLAKRKWLTLRKFVLVAASMAASALVWHRTGGDQLLTSATGPLVFAALDNWIRDESPASHGGPT
jgi:hypothetical protein